MNGQAPGTEKNKYECIDVIKLISSFLVIGAHAYHFKLHETPFWRLFSYGIQGYLVRVAVPFFFVATGFFAFRNVKELREYRTQAVRYAKRTYRLYIVWTVLYLPLIIRSMAHQTKDVWRGILYFFRNLVFSGSYNHLWYLTAVAFAILLTGFLVSKGMSIHKVLACATALYLIGLLGQSYYGLIYPLHNIPWIWNLLKGFINVTVTTRNGLFDAFFFVALGVYFALRPVHMKLSAAIAGFIGSMALLLGEILILIRLGWIRECDMYLSLIPALYFLFYISLNIKMKESPIYIKIRYVSMVTYFIHVWVLAIIYEMFVVMGVTWLNYGMLLVLAMIASVGVSALIVYLSNTEKGEFLKRLYR